MVKPRSYWSLEKIVKIAERSNDKLNFMAWHNGPQPVIKNITV